MHNSATEFCKTEISRNKTAVPITATDRSALTQIQHIVLCQFHITFLARFSFPGETGPIFYLLSSISLYIYQKPNKKP